MQIEVNLTASYKIVAGRNSLKLDLQEGSTVQDAFYLIVKKIPGLKIHWLDKEGTPAASVHIFLNGDDISTLTDGFETRLVDRDLLEFTPPLSKG
jgi:molybdopterin converting factor small subunit